ncbi:helix-turn-helix domain-containing protein [Streptomyces sp. DSM 42041]|uniref:Helix-turn-helix domain-containing protein n=1 Tax=Streptomyces hazeniae TaxID=3075538 RepID=A0ABU2NVM8_9ACTN|nr:helix-turn-helix domain-containing protein [Streptomyces sp. DSM 42041]MDT0380288.1 helix-turn-helix domain-containing protein [Streptomyces sp. DSM 42041]
MSTALTTPAERLLYKPADAAEVLSVGRSTVYELVAEGVLKSTKVRGSMRIRRSDLEHYVANLAIVTR